jgi:hypothetical protein
MSAHALLAATVLLVLAACGGDGSPAPADAAADDDAAPIDAPGVCTVPNECPCFSNDDCPEGTRCHSEGEDVYCEPGPRGTGAAGTVCTNEDDCESSLCVEGTDTFRCSKTCTSPTDCPPELPRCLGGIGICARDL